MYKKDDLVYFLFAGTEPYGDPVATFSSKDTLESLVGRLARFIEGGISLVKFQAKDNGLPVDKYAILVNLGLTPYTISLHRDGFLFEPSDQLGWDLDEPTMEQQSQHIKQMLAAQIKDPAKQWGLGGVFWAPDRGLALKKAKLMRKILFTALGISLKPVQDEN